MTRTRTRRLLRRPFVVDPKNYIELTCCSLAHEPNLRSVKPGTEVLNFDALKASTLVGNKKVFQGMIGPCPLGENTAGGAQAYTRRLNGIKMIICSNHFAEDIEELTPAGQKYIWENIFYLKLEPGENMYMPVAPPTLASTSDCPINDDGMWLLVTSGSVWMPGFSLRSSIPLLTFIIFLFVRCCFLVFPGCCSAPKKIFIFLHTGLSIVPFGCLH